MSLRSALVHPFHGDLRPGETDRLPVADVSLLFVDVAGSTDLTVRFGDRGAYSLIRHFCGVVHEATRHWEGQALELRGDGALLAFCSPRAALECALEIQGTCSRDGRLGIRMGLHAGRALRIRGGYFGHALILAARIAEHALADEILVSSQLVKRLSNPSAYRIDPRTSLSLKGFATQVEVFRINWRGKDVCATRADGVGDPPPSISCSGPLRPVAH